jgi:hypothetical protein
MPDYTLITIPPAWVSAAALDEVQVAAGDPLNSEARQVVIRVQRTSKPMTDVVLILLSLANQMAASGREVTLQFDGGWNGVMGYLDRVGFFQLLDASIRKHPPLPTRSRATTCAGGNRGVVEIRRLRADARGRDAPRLLVAALEAATSSRRDAQALATAGFTVFAELIDNIYEHSSTHLDGYAGLQVYANGNSVRAAVSDSGLGILDTLRAGSLDWRDACLGDSELIVELFRRGISRHGRFRGCGLRRCADHALRFGGVLHLRLPRCRVRLVPGASGYQAAVAYYKDNLPLIQGTHLHFEFQLDDGEHYLI